MTTVIDGKNVAASVIQTVKSATAALEKSSGVTTGLAVVIVGDDPASHAYVGSKSRMAKECGFKSVQHTLPAETKQEDLAALVASLNADPSIHGILVQLPLPKQLDSEAIIQSILPEKDVDGLSVVNAGKLATGDLKTGLVSCTPAGAMVFVRRTHGEDLSGLNAVVIGRSNLFGKPMAQLLLERQCDGDHRAFPDQGSRRGLPPRRYPGGRRRPAGNGQGRLGQARRDGHRRRHQPDRGAREEARARAGSSATSPSRRLRRSPAPSPRFPAASGR